MEFIVNNRKYSILNHELYINYLMVDSYFSQHSKYDYDIHFDFLDSILEKEKIEFDDILEGTKQLEEMIDREEINFLPAGVIIDLQNNEKFKIIYQTIEFDDVSVGEAIPLLICLTSLLNTKPVVSLYQIDDELQNFLEKFREYQD